MTKGYWVKFQAQPGDYAGAQRSVDGKVVGILTPGGVDSASGERTEHRINVVTKDAGVNLVELADGEIRNVVVDPATVEFCAADVPADCPIDRVRHLLGS
jgi:hypothetical protein